MVDHLTLFYSLSLSQTPEQYVTTLRKNSVFVNGDVKLLVDSFIEGYEQEGHFPSFASIGAKVGSDLSAYTVVAVSAHYGSVATATSVLWDQFQREVSKDELRSLESRLIFENDETEKRKLLSEYTRLVVDNAFTTGATIVEDSDIEMATDASVLAENGIVFPIQKINDDLGSLAPGQNAVILGGPGSFKTTLALNLVYYNSIERDRSGMYFYMEDAPDQYMKKLFSRFTYSHGQKIHKDILLRGAEDEDTKELIRRQSKAYLDYRKGKLCFMGMSGMPSEPYEFAIRMSKIVNERKLDYVVFDYAQCMNSYRPPKYGQFDYLNQFFQTWAALALGQFDNRPFVFIVLTQTTKDALKRSETNGGRYSLADGAEISTLERMAFAYVSLYGNDNLKAGGQLQWQLLKARNANTLTQPVITHVIPEYSFLGDVIDLQDVYEPGSVSQNFSTSDFDADFAGLL